jgi:glycosyltransferase involved in cell wall biosynthesis
VDDDTFILGNVGRFVYQKNHEFMLNVFATLKKIRSNSKLLLVGEGVLEAELKQLAKSLKIEDSVIFYGVTHDVPAVLSAMDAFIFPSRFEGFGIVAIEAQVSGLPVWCSTAIPQMAKICDEFKYIDSDSCDKWAEVISEYHDHYQRMPHIDNARKAGYDITSLSADMQEYYEHRVCKM